MSYTAPTSAKITTASNVTWSSGALFSGYLLLGIALPSDSLGNPWAQVNVYGTSQQLPLWTVIPIIEGQLDANTGVFYTATIDPPNTRYAAYWYDSTWKLIYPIGSQPAVFSIASNPYVITQPTLTSPVTATSFDPTPQTPGSTTTYRNLIDYTLVGSADGVNTIFTIPYSPISGASVFIDGQKQDLSTYTRVGSVVVFNTAPTFGSSVTAYVNVDINATSQTSTLISTSAGTITGAIDSSNTIYTLTTVTSAVSIDLSVNGLVYVPDVDYTLVGLTVTLLSYVPVPGDIIRARVWSTV